MADLRGTRRKLTVIAVVLGAWLFGEHLNWGDAAGMTLMLGAAGLALRRPEVAR